MEPVTVSVFILLLGTLQQVQRLGNMLIPAKRGMGEIMATVVGVIAILVLTYLYGQTPVHHGAGLLAMMIITLYPFTFGITSKGISYKRGVMMGFLAPWQKIKDVRMVIKRDTIKVSFFGHGYCDLYFNEDKYEALVDILEEKLSPGCIGSREDI